MPNLTFKDELVNMILETISPTFLSVTVVNKLFKPMYLLSIDYTVISKIKIYDKMVMNTQMLHRFFIVFLFKKISSQINDMKITLFTPC